MHGCRLRRRQRRGGPAAVWTTAPPSHPAPTSPACRSASVTCLRQPAERCAIYLRTVMEAQTAAAAAVGSCLLRCLGNTSAQQTVLIGGVVYGINPKPCRSSGPSCSGGWRSWGCSRCGWSSTSPRPPPPSRCVLGHLGALQPCLSPSRLWSPARLHLHLPWKQCDVIANAGCIRRKLPGAGRHVCVCFLCFRVQRCRRRRPAGSRAAPPQPSTSRLAAAAASAAAA
jgi:hypothetical protein